jgi:diguanylate cyclase (GGDEF)-like protein
MPSLGFVVMLSKANAFLAAQSSLRIGTLSFLLIAIVGAFDLATGYELSFSIFYAIPVGIASWYAGMRWGLLVSIVSAASWFAADYASGHPYSYATIPIWNASVRLGYFVIIASLLDRLRGALELQESLAERDGLTGILNARTFRQRCDSVFDLAARHKRPLALGYLDLDGFKGVNDSLGHSVGDQVLIAVAAELTKRLRASDFGGRLGGDEFAIVLPETDLAGARTFFTALRESLIELATQNYWPVGFSIGVAAFHSPTANPDDAIRRADDLMYRVKNSGKNNILFEEFSSSVHSA